MRVCLNFIRLYAIIRLHGNQEITFTYLVALSSQAGVIVLVQNVLPSKSVTTTFTSEPVAMVMTCTYLVASSSQADIIVLVQSVVPSKSVTTTFTSEPVAMVMMYTFP